MRQWLEPQSAGAIRAPVYARRVNEHAHEVVLTGGRLTDGVVRVGSTVRRPRKPCSPFMSRLLRHLEAVGFAGAPRYLGVDELGRDIFSYVEGDVHPKWQRWTDEQVEAAGRLLRAFHDASAGSALAAGQETVCHHDAGPNNFVFQDGLPVALIDFDFAAPGTALDDLAYAAWAWCISSKPQRLPVEAQAAQVRLLVDAYGFASGDRAAIVEAIVARQEQNIRWWKERLDDDGISADNRPYAHEVIEWTRREREFTAAHEDAFASALGLTPQEARSVAA